MLKTDDPDNLPRREREAHEILISCYARLPFRRITIGDKTWNIKNNQINSVHINRRAVANDSCNTFCAISARERSLGPCFSRTNRQRVGKQRAFLFRFFPLILRTKPCALAGRNGAGLLIHIWPLSGRHFDCIHIQIDCIAIASSLPPFRRALMAEHFSHFIWCCRPRARDETRRSKLHTDQLRSYAL